MKDVNSNARNVGYYWKTRQSGLITTKSQSEKQKKTASKKRTWINLEEECLRGSSNTSAADTPTTETTLDSTFKDKAFDNFA